MKISQEELETIRTTKSNIIITDLLTQIATSKVEAAHLEFKTAKLEHENIMLKIAVKYNLSIKDSINEFDGEIKTHIEEQNDKERNNEETTD